MTDPISESAKATQEVAKAAGKGIDAATKAGSFIAKMVEAPLEQAVGIWTDKLKYTRWERQLALMQRANVKLAELGLSEPSRAIPLKLAIPLLQEGSMEEDDYLQERWANLLVNAANADSGVDVKAAFISMLKDMSSLDVQNLNAIYSLPYDKAVEKHVWTGDLPTSARLLEEEDSNKNGDAALSAEVRMSLENLKRLGCLNTASNFWGGGTYFFRIIPTSLGREFVRACSIRL